KRAVGSDRPLCFYIKDRFFCRPVFLILQKMPFFAPDLKDGFRERRKSRLFLKFFATAVAKFLQKRLHFIIYCDIINSVLF
ncbi:MAG: hypothetical protein J5879_06325, partial [Clostridia bacterium]|nr:hypothetical protein [Clostridia bacterium]